MVIVTTPEPAQVVTATTHATADEKIAWVARVWRQADKEAIADRSDEQKKRAEYWTRSALRQAIDMAERRG